MNPALCDGSCTHSRGDEKVNASIPNLFHFIFGLKKQKESFHLAFYLCIESCRQVNQPDEIVLHYHYEPHGKYWDHLKDSVTLSKVALSDYVRRYRYGFRDRYNRKYNYAHHSDFIRLEKLIEHGGVYVDIDTIFVNKIPEHLFEKPFVLGREADVWCQHTGRLKRSLCNAFIMSEKQSVFATRWRQEMEKVFDGSWSNHSTFLPQQLSEQYPHLIHIEPSRTFYGHMWTKEGIRTLLKGCDTDYGNMVSMHLWSHLWWSKQRRDFSDFHAGQLSEAFIREVDTTYNLVARKYLPGLD